MAKFLGTFHHLMWKRRETMKIKVMTLKFNPETGQFDDDALTIFQEETTVNQFDSHFFTVNGVSFLSFVITYDSFQQKTQILKRRDIEKKEIEELTPEESELFEKLKAVRKEKAFALGLPVYVLATNADILKVMKHRCVTMETLKNDAGFGKKKVSNIGKEFIDIMKNQVGRGQEPKDAG